MIPDGWKIISIEDSHIDIIDGDRGKNYPKQEEFSPEGFCLFLNASNVTKAGFNFDNCQFVPKERDRLLRKGKLERNDLVLTTRGTVGNVAFFDSSIPFEVQRINSGMVILRNKDPHIDNRFVYLVLGSDLFQNQVKRIAFGSAQPQLTVGTIKKLKIPLPPLPEQRAIAAILGTWDRAIALTERRLAAAEQRKQALMQQLLTGRVRFPEFVGEEWREGKLKDVFARVTRKNEQGTPNILSITASVGFQHQAEKFGRVIAGKNLGSLGIDVIEAYLVVARQTSRSLPNPGRYVGTNASG